MNWRQFEKSGCCWHGFRSRRYLAALDGISFGSILVVASPLEVLSEIDHFWHKRFPMLISVGCSRTRYRSFSNIQLLLQPPESVRLHIFQSQTGDDRKSKKNLDEVAAAAAAISRGEIWAWHQRKVTRKPFFFFFFCSADLNQYFCFSGDKRQAAKRVKAAFSQSFSFVRGWSLASSCQNSAPKIIWKNRISESDL